MNYCNHDDESAFSKRTNYLEIFPKTLINKVTSPDVPFGYSINPYQGCEHGCVYCYARNSHQYWGYSAGLEFEQKILVKKDAPTMLRNELLAKSWKPKLIMLSGNTDCYQPIEKSLKITRELLKIMLKYNHPVGLITKNSLVIRDIDLLEKLQERNLLRITVSITTLNEDTRRKMEPRTASTINKLKALELLSKHGIPVHVNLAPIIPGLNDFEIPDILKKVASVGAKSASYMTVRLNGEIGDVFSDWVKRVYPERAQKVLNQISELHDGNLGSSEFKTRMKGKGVLADQIKSLFEINKRKYFEPYEYAPIDNSLFRPNRGGQLSIF